MRKIYILLLACSLLSLFVACNDNDYKASVTELRLVLVKPTNVYSGEIATILGRNFSTVPEENAVFINDQQATVIEAFKDELKIILPEMAPGNIRGAEPRVGSPAHGRENTAYTRYNHIDCDGRTQKNQTAAGRKKEISQEEHCMSRQFQRDRQLVSTGETVGFTLRNSRFP